jgi:feruloyl-CoA synthase
MVQDGVMFEKALAALDLDGITVIHVDRAPANIKSVAYADLAATPVTSAAKHP